MTALPPTDRAFGADAADPAPLPLAPRAMPKQVLVAPPGRAWSALAGWLLRRLPRPRRAG